jgi:hypothetical protein
MAFNTWENMKFPVHELGDTAMGKIATKQYRSSQDLPHQMITKAYSLLILRGRYEQRARVHEIFHPGRLTGYCTLTQNDLTAYH